MEIIAPFIPLIPILAKRRDETQIACDNDFFIIILVILFVIILFVGFIYFILEN